MRELRLSLSLSTSSSLLAVDVVVIGSVQDKSQQQTRATHIPFVQQHTRMNKYFFLEETTEN